MSISDDADNGTDESTLKDQAVFFIDRRISELTTTKASHEAMAEAGMPYEQRSRHLQAAEDQQQERATELQAMRWARDKLLEIR